MVKLNHGDRIGHYPYRILKSLGDNHGNMAEVFLATEGDIEKPPHESLVVVKISRAQQENEDFFRDTIKNEAERLRELQHDGIVRILPLKTTTEMRQAAYEGRATALPGSPWFLVLEYLEGGSLRELLNTHKQLDVKFALEVARRVAKTLDHVHRLTHVHLDIKPENILFRHKLGGGAPIEPVLIDFGIARNVGQTGLEASTLVYAPPERVQQSRSAPEIMPRPDPSMDVYSLGVVLYQMVAGRRPFDGRGAKHISTAILKGNPTVPSTYSRVISPELDDIIMRTLHKSPSIRPTAGELEKELTNLLYRLSNGELQQQGPTTTSVISAIPRHRRRLYNAGFMSPAFYAVTALLVLALGGQAATKLTTGHWWLPSIVQVQQLPSQVGGFVQELSGGLGPEPLAVSNTDGSNELAEGEAERDDPERDDSKNGVVENGESGPDSAASTSPDDASESVDEAAAGNGVAGESAATDEDEPAVLEPTATAVPALTAPEKTGTATARPTAPPTATATSAPPTSTPVPDIAPPVAARTSLVDNEESRSVPSGDGASATSTPVPDFTETPKPTNTATAVPASPTSPAPPPTRPPLQPTKPPQNRTATLLFPDDGGSGRGRIEFRWSANFALGPNEAFEPIFWRDGEEPMVSGKGWGGPTTGNSLLVDFTDVAPDNYRWGVLLIKSAPTYQRVQLLGGSRSFSVQGSDSSSTGRGK